MGSDNTGSMEPLPSSLRSSRGPGLGPYLGVLVGLGKVLLIAVDVQPNGGARTPGATQSKDDARTIGKNESQALGKISRDLFFLSFLP